jgi:uncharacterized membrane protein HdeD (DUF308 family)
MLVAASQRTARVLNRAAREGVMAPRLFFTILSLVLAAAAFLNADPSPDINLFGVLFLFFAFVAWFAWADIQAGYAYQAERREQSHTIPLMLGRC